MLTDKDREAITLYADRLESHLQVEKFDTLLAHDIRSAVAWLRRVNDGWRGVATDPPPLNAQVLYQDERGQVGLGMRRALKYHTHPERAKPWMDSTNHTMPAPVLWQPLPEARKQS